MAGRAQPPPAWTVWLSAPKKFLNAVRDAFQAKIKSAHRKSFPIAIIAIACVSADAVEWKARLVACPAAGLAIQALSSLMVQLYVGDQLERAIDQIDKWSRGRNMPRHMNGAFCGFQFV